MGFSSAGVFIQGSSRISSSEGREQGLGARHRRIRAQQSVGSRSTGEISSQQGVHRLGKNEASLAGVSDRPYLGRHEQGNAAQPPESPGLSRRECPHRPCHRVGLLVTRR